MKQIRTRIVAVAMIGLAVVIPSAVFAGGELADEDAHDHDGGGDTTKGPYGFVKDTRGAAVPDATVMVDIKNRGQIVTQTNIMGAYQIPAYGIEIKPDDVQIGCKKEGYKQVNVLQRPSMGDPKAGFEVECTLQRQ